MTTYEIGENIPLSALVTWFGKLVNGAQDVKVRVIETPSGEELLPETSMTESVETPGLYFTTMIGLDSPKEMAAIYTSRNYSAIETIRIVRPKTQITEGVSVVIDDETLTVAVEQEQPQSLMLDSEQELSIQHDNSSEIVLSTEQDGTIEVQEETL